jgi:DHA3 family macrolide efflux protein-like MFS transporter
MTDTGSTPRRLTGMLGFTIVCLGQVVSILASNMTGFALAIWVFQKTSSATALGIMQSAFVVPYLVFIPIAGALVDRYDRKLLMMVSDFTAALGTLAIFVLYATGMLEIWHFYAVNVLIGLGSAFHWPAYSAAITTMVPKAQYGRANGLMSLVQAGPGVLAPLLAGALLPLIGLNGILLIDMATFVVAIGALLVVHVPPPVRTAEGQEGKGSLLREAAFGFRYIFRRPSLLGLVVLLFFANLFLGFPNSVTVPLVLLRTGNDSLVLGAVQTAGAVSWVIGSLLMSAWGGFKRRIHGVLLGWSLYCVFGAILFGLGRDLTIWIPALLGAGIMATVGNTSSQALLQAKVAPDVQGRVFSARRMISWAPDALTPVLGGVLADLVMEPAMRSESVLASALGWLVGTGPGAGMSLLMIFFGLCTMLTLLSGYLIQRVRNIQEILPDHDQLPAVES